MLNRKFRPWVDQNTSRFNLSLLHNFPNNPEPGWHSSPLHYIPPFFLLSTLEQIPWRDQNGSVWCRGLKRSLRGAEQNFTLPEGRTEVKLEISATSHLFLTLCPLLLFVILTEQVNLCPFTPALNLRGWKRHAFQCLKSVLKGYNQIQIYYLK